MYPYCVYLDRITGEYQIVSRPLKTTKDFVLLGTYGDLDDANAFVEMQRQITPIHAFYDVEKDVAWTTKVPQADQVPSHVARKAFYPLDYNGGWAQAHKQACKWASERNGSMKKLRRSLKLLQENGVEIEA